MSPKTNHLIPAMKITVYTPTSSLTQPGRLLQAMFHDLWRGRELAWRLVIRNVSAMYRQTILGYLWAFLPPLAAAATFILLNHGGILSVAPTAIPYAAWTLLGSFLWQAFADALNNPMRQVSQARGMLTKINFPREALIMAGIGETLFNFCIRCIILVPIYFIFDLHVLWTGLTLLPLALLALIALGTMLGIFLTPAAMLFGDVEKGVSLLLPFLMLLSGAVVPIPPTGAGHVIAQLNPIYPLLETCRDLMSGQPPHLLIPAAGVVAATVLCLFAGWILYRISMPHLIARLGG